MNECNQPLPERGEREVVVMRKVLPILKRGKAASSKVPCRNWLYGNGTCKYAERCRYSHDAYAGRGVDFKNARVISGRGQQPQEKCAPGGFTKLNGVKELNNVFARSLWREDDSDDECTLHRLVRGAPAVMIESKVGTIVNDFVPKRNLIEPSVIIGSKIPKTDERRFFIGGKGCFGTSFSFENEKVSNLSETKFEVSLDGDFSRNCEFVVTLPIMESSSSDSCDSSKGCRFRPRRDGREVQGSSNGGESSPKGKSEAAFGGSFDDLTVEEDQTSSESEEGRSSSYLNRVAGMWERRALRAEESLARYQQGLMERKGEAKLSDTLSFLLNSDSGVMDERSVDNRNERAYDTMPRDDWLVLKIPQGNRAYAMCDFCDGDDLDDKQWLEGPFSLNLTLRELVDHGKETTREKRRSTNNAHAKVRMRKRKEKRAGGPIAEGIGSSSSAAPLSAEEEIRAKQRRELQHYNEKKAESFEIPSRKALRHAKRSSSKSIAARDETNGFAGNRTAGRDIDQIFREGVKRCAPIDLIENGQGTKRLRNRADLAQTPAAEDESNGIAQPAASVVIPTVDAWPIRGPTLGRKRRKRMSRRQREGLNPSCRRERERLEAMGNRPTYIPRQDRPRTPKWKVGDSIKFYDAKNRFREGFGMITAVIQPGIVGYSPDDGEYRYEIDVIYCENQSSSGWVMEQHIKPVVKRSAMPMSDSVKGDALHPLDYIGIDTCSAMSVSTEQSDFLFIDKSLAAVRSVSLGGVGGNGSVVMGRGPMLIKLHDGNGNVVFIVDPAGVYLKSSMSQSRLRILGQQRMKAHGFNIHQNKFKDNLDYLVYKSSRAFLLETKRGILLLKTMPITQNERKSKSLNSAVDMIVSREDQNCCFTFCADNDN